MRLLLVPALVLVLAGCSEQTPGNATAGDEIPPSSEAQVTTESSEETTTTTEAGTPLADVDPCDLVSDAAATQLGLTGGTAETLGEARVCRWRLDGPTLNESFSVQVEIFEKRGLADIVGTNIQQLPPIGTHQAASFIGTAGGCGVSVGVGESARVDNTAVGGNQQQGCQLVTQLATLVEPELP